MIGRITAEQARKAADNVTGIDATVWIDKAHEEIHSAAARGGRRITFDPFVSGHLPTEAENEAIMNSLVVDGYNVFFSERLGRNNLVISW